MAVTMAPTRAMASMRWTVISMPSVAWVRWTVRVMMVVVPRPICRPPVVVRAAIRLIDVGIAIPVAVSRAHRVASRQQQDEGRDSKQFFHVRSLDGPNSRGFSMCKPGFVHTAAGILKMLSSDMPRNARQLAKGLRLHPGNACKWPSGRLTASRPAFAASSWAPQLCGMAAVPSPHPGKGAAQWIRPTRHACPAAGLQHCSTAALRDG